MDFLGVFCFVLFVSMAVKTARALQDLVQACTGHWKTEMFQAPCEAIGESGGRGGDQTGSLFGEPPTEICSKGSQNGVFTGVQKGFGPIAFYWQVLVQKWSARCGQYEAYPRQNGVFACFCWLDCESSSHWSSLDWLWAFSGWLHRSQVKELTNTGFSFCFSPPPSSESLVFFLWLPKAILRKDIEGLFRMILG